MQRPGPPLETLLRRVAETPPDFLDETRIGTSGTVAVAAVVNDLLAGMGQRASQAVLDRFRGKDAATDRNRLLLVLALCWLLADDGLRDAKPAQAELLTVLDDAARELAANAGAHKYLHDPDRREELVRVVLARLGMRPAGETLEQATDRLSALSATERKRLLAASRDAEARARAIREALVRKAAEASADKWTRE